MFEGELGVIQIYIRKIYLDTGSSLLCSAVVSYDVTHFRVRVRSTIGIRLDRAVLGSGAK